MSRKPIECPVCEGEGKNPCGHCDGKGVKYYNNDLTDPRPCTLCNGDKAQVCSACQGKGTIWADS